MLIDCIPETAANFSILATRYEELGTSLGRNGRNKEAEAAYEKATALGNATTEPNPLTQARSISNLAIVLQKQGKLGEAERLYREAVEQYERLARARARAFRSTERSSPTRSSISARRSRGIPRRSSRFSAARWKPIRVW